MKKQVPLVLLALIVISSSLKTQAQSLGADSIKAQMLADWERAKAYTADYLNTMPAGKYSLKPTDSIRSFAQQMLHMAQGNLYLMSTATDIQAPGWLQADLEHSAGAMAKDSVVYYVNASYDYCSNAIKQLDMVKWGEKKKMFGMEASRWALVMKTFEHQTHHRGQTTVYLRMAGVKPPQERLF